MPYKKGRYSSNHIRSVGKWGRGRGVDAPSEESLSPSRLATEERQVIVSRLLGAHPVPCGSGFGSLPHHIGRGFAR